MWHFQLGVVVTTSPEFWGRRTCFICDVKKKSLNYWAKINLQHWQISQRCLQTSWNVYKVLHFLAWVLSLALLLQDILAGWKLKLTGLTGVPASVWNLLEIETLLRFVTARSVQWIWKDLTSNEIKRIIEIKLRHDWDSPKTLWEWIVRNKCAGHLQFSQFICCNKHVVNMNLVRSSKMCIVFILLHFNELLLVADTCLSECPLSASVVSSL